MMMLMKKMNKQKLKQKYYDMEIDENLRVDREAEAREKAACEVDETLKNQKTLFPSCSME